MTPQTLTIGTVCIDLYDGWTVTRFPDGATLTARHDDCQHLGQQRTAVDLGYQTVEAMNRDHDLVHHLLSHWLGLEVSPTLFAAAHGQEYLAAGYEEAAVLSLQRFMQTLGIDPLTLVTHLSPHLLAQ